MMSFEKIGIFFPEYIGRQLELYFDFGIYSSPLQNKPTFWGFPYKIGQAVRVENHLNVMSNPQIFPQLLALM